jgi:hypothetical protein
MTRTVSPKTRRVVVPLVRRGQRVRVTVVALNGARQASRPRVKVLVAGRR